MKTRKIIASIGLLLGIIALAAPQMAEAVGTAACTVVSNTAHLTYQVGGVDPTGGAGVDPAVPATFTVGNKVMVTVEKSDSSAVSVIPNSSAANLVAANKYLTFTVTNAGNAVQDYTLAVLNPSGEADIFGGAADSFDLSGVTAYLDVNNNGVYDAGDTATTILQLDPTVTYGANPVGTRKVFIVPTGATPVVPVNQANGTQAVYILQATSNKGNGLANTVETQNQNNGLVYKIGGGSCNADIVLAENTHTSNKTLPSAEVHWDGKDTARDTFIVATAAIAVSKTSVVYSDPVNLLVTPKAIPGAVIRYTISIANTGSASATLTTISDALNAALQIVSTAGGASWSVPASARTTKSGTLTADTADANTDGLGHTNTALVGGTLTWTLATILKADVPNGYAAGELKTNETINLVFDATIQ
jgi:uncharacterized repeat protein (TIGR01451 family)